MNSTKVFFLLINLAIFFLISSRIDAQWSLTGNTPSASEFIGTTDASNFRFKTNNTERMVILSGGNIGIGITNPTNKLDIDGMVNSTVGFTYGATYGGAWDIWGTHARFTTNSNTDALRLWTSKSLSSIWLQVNNGGRGVVMDGSSANFLFVGGSSETLSGIGNANGTGNLTLLYSTAANSSTEGARLSSTGNFLVGTTTDGSYKLDVNGTGRFTGNVGMLSYTTTAPSYMNTTTSTALVTTTSGGTPGIQIADNVRPSLTLNMSGVVARGIGIINSSGDIAINVPTFSGANTHIFYGDGKTYLSNDVGIGVLSPTARLHSNGTVRFEGLTNNNALTQILASDASGNISWRDASTLGGGSATDWSLTGNAGTNPSTHFIGTTDAQPVVFKVANNEAIRLNTDRSVSFQAGTAQTVAQFSGNEWYGSWFNINNGSANPSPFSGIRLRVNETNKVQIFYNANSYSQGGSFDVLAGNAEMLSRGGDVYLSTGTFKSNGLIVKNTTGNVGIGNTTPLYKLDVNGTARFGSNDLSNSMVINTLGDIGIGIEPTPNIGLLVKKDADATVGLQVENVNTGGNAFAAVQLGQDVTTAKTKFLNIGFANSDFTPYGVYQPAGSFIVNNGDGGLGMAAYSTTGNPKMRFYTGNDVLDGNMRMIIDETGNVGIGNATPSYKLDVNGTARFGSNDLSSSMVINTLGDIGIGIEPTPNIAMQVKKDADATVGLRLENVNTGGNAFAAVQLGQDITTTATKFLNIGFANSEIMPYGVYQPAGSFIVNNGDGGLGIAAYSTTGNPKMRFYTGNDVLDGNMRMIIDETGKVGIGTTSLSDNNYKLFVETGIRTRKVKVDQSTWPDYVFHRDYKLPDLNEVEKFIQKNKHLPEVPSTTEIEKNGLDLGDNQAVLLKKIEELTLYMIELNKKVDKLSAENEKMKSELKIK